MWVQRRTFLGAAAAAANLSYVNDEREDDEAEGEKHRSKRRFPQRSADIAEIRVPSPTEWEPEISVNGHHSDEWDEHHVEVTVQVGQHRCWFTLTPKQAHQVVEDLEAAAEFAERGE